MLQSGTPNTGYVLVEINYNYHQILGMPWFTQFVADPVRVPYLCSLAVCFRRTDLDDLIQDEEGDMTRTPHWKKVQRWKTSGQALILIILTFFGLLFFLGLMIDLGQIFLAKGYLRRAADAASLAAAAQFRENRTIDQMTGCGGRSGAHERRHPDVGHGSNLRFHRRDRPAIMPAARPRRTCPRNSSG